MQIDFISPHDPRWNEALRIAEHDVYDLPEYARVCAKYEAATPIAFYASEGTQCCLIPLLQRALPLHLQAPESWSDAVSPYGYSSALFVGDAEWSLRVVSEFVRVCSQRDIISVFVRLHPLLAAPAAVLDASGVRVTHGNTVHVDLSLPEQVLRMQLRKDHKLRIARLCDQGFNVVLDDWSLFDRFVHIYWDTMRRRDADQYYLLPADYFRDLRDALGPRLHLLSVIAPDHSVAAAGLFTETSGIAQFHLSGTAPEHQRSAPSKLMLDRAIMWAKTAGNRVLHLGGGVGSRHDGLYDFKGGFSPLRSAFRTWRVVCDVKRYLELSGAARATNASSDGFFPLYRKPI
jgi:GNAT acetyltransferase-like protein